MGQRLLITEAEKITIQFKYGMKIHLLEQSDNLSKKELFQQLNDTFTMGPKTKRAVLDTIETNYGKTSSKVLMSLLLPILINMTSCQNTGGNTEDCDTETEIELSGEMLNIYGKFDTDGDGKLNQYEKDEYGRYYADSLINAGKTDRIMDKVKNSEENSNINITNVKITHDEHSSKWDNVKVTFKNTSNKTIKAIRFIWYDVKNSFGEEIDPTYGGGNMERVIKPGQKTSGEWETYEDQIESAKVYVEKIAYTDGTIWENK